MLAQSIEGDFLVTVIQQLVLALGLALAGANAFALVSSRRKRKRYEADLAAYEQTRKLKDMSKRRAKPEEPKRVRPTAAILNILIGLLIAIVATASLTLDWLG